MGAAAGQIQSAIKTKLKSGLDELLMVREILFALCTAMCWQLDNPSWNKNTKQAKDMSLFADYRVYQKKWT